MPRAASRIARIRSAAATSASSRPSIGVVPACPAAPSKKSSPRAYPTIEVTIPSGAPRVGQPRTLFDVELEERLRQRPPRSHERSASDAADFLSAEDDDGAGADTLDRLDRGNDAERAVEPAAAGNRVEMRADHTSPDRAACPKRLP